MTKEEIRKLFGQHDVALSREDVWEVQGTPVIKHSALERLAAALKIVWDMPTIVRAERDECVILARASRKDGVSEWSFGEALIVGAAGAGGNYKVSGKQASYVYAMAEKRAKDRVIVKLAGLHGAYSEEEAEDFSSRNADREERPSRQQVERVEVRDPVPQIEKRVEQPVVDPTPEPVLGTDVAVEQQAVTPVPANLMDQEAAEAAPATKVTSGASEAASEPAERPAANGNAMPQDLKDTLEALKAKIDATKTVNECADLMLSTETQALFKEVGEVVTKRIRDYGRDHLVKKLNFPIKPSAKVNA